MMALQEGQREQRSTAKVEEDLEIWTSRLGKFGGRGWVRCSFLPLGDEYEPILGLGGIAHHLAAD